MRIRREDSEVLLWNISAVEVRRKWWDTKSWVGIVAVLAGRCCGRADRRRARKPTLTTLIEGTIDKGQSVADKRRNRAPWGVLLLATWAILVAGAALIRKLLGSVSARRTERRKARKPTSSTPIQGTDERRNRTLWVVLLLAALGALAVGAVLWGLNNAERHLTAEAEEALAATGLPVTVEVSGRDVILSGELDATDQARAIELVRAISGIRQVEWESLPTASATTTTTETVETTVTSTVTSVDTSRPPITSTTGVTGTTTTDVSVLPSSEGDDAGASPELPRTGADFTVALLGIVALLAGTLLVRRARRWEFRDQGTSERLATLKGLTALNGSELDPRPAEDPLNHK